MTTLQLSLLSPVRMRACELETIGFVLLQGLSASGWSVDMFAHISPFPSQSFSAFHVVKRGNMVSSKDERTVSHWILEFVMLLVLCVTLGKSHLLLLSLGLFQQRVPGTYLCMFGLS